MTGSKITKKIAICGSQCSGKTTLVRTLQSHPDFLDYHFYSSASREVKLAGHGVNLDVDNVGQLLILSKFLSRTVTPDAPKCVYDRCILDAMAFTSVSFYNCKIDEWVYDYALNLYNTLIPMYDYVFYLPPVLQLEEDGVRNIDDDFVQQVTEQYRRLLSSCPRKVYLIDGNVEQRLQSLLRIVNEQH